MNFGVGGLHLTLCQNDIPAQSFHTEPKTRRPYTTFENSESWS